MIYQAIKEWNIDASKSLLIGDKETDLKAAQCAGIESKLFDFKSQNILKTFKKDLLKIKMMM